MYLCCFCSVSQAKHESVCQRWYSRKSKGGLGKKKHSSTKSSARPEPSSKQSYANGTSDYDNVSDTNATSNGPSFSFRDKEEKSKPAPQPSKTSKQDWKKSHEDLIHNIRTAREAMRAEREKKHKTTPPAPADDKPGQYVAQ